LNDLGREGEIISLILITTANGIHAAKSLKPLFSFLNLIICQPSNFRREKGFLGYVFKEIGVVKL